jgi:DNA-3-methyladenine glycosylase I
LVRRCAWCGSDPLYVAYHDDEWGVPTRDDRHLFEMLILEGAQAGLSWSTILKKREKYRIAFDGFDVERVAAYTDRDVQRLLGDRGIVRNRLKVTSAVRNARATLAVTREFGSFAAYLWGFVDDTPITEVSDRMSRELNKRGFNFVGSTICYAFMQAVGMVNDHTTDCFCYDASKLFSRGPG